MRRYLATAITTLTICASLVFATSASAQDHGPYLCWTSTFGATRCVDLPGNYSLHGIRAPLGAYDTVSFTLTREMINYVLPSGSNLTFGARA